MNTLIYIQSWEKDHLTQREMAIPIIYRFLQNIKAITIEIEPLNGIKR